MFDSATRNLLANFVARSRRLLCGEYNKPGGEITSLLQTYGIQPDGTVAKLESLPGLDQRGYEVATTLRELLAYKRANSAGVKSWGKYDPHVYDLIQEQAFTVLNRLCALRMAEERGILPYPVVSKGMGSDGFELYEMSADKKRLSREERYESFLFSIFDELSLDLQVLFDRFATESLLFPRPEALAELLAEINAPALSPLWSEDETIGWVYQYWNSKEERKAMRDASAAPRNSRELAVRNQFFTPRYVVEFLTDNTLGRIWYEMNRGQTRLADQCRYLVRRPTEIFLAEGETSPETPDQEGLTQEELLRQPVHIPHRPLKDPREIRLLDPACGSMHFGLYAFDLFETIYEEAWDNGSCPALQQAYASRDAFLQDVPRLIIEHNIHGIDIDPRAVQIAGLSLWLRAQKAWQARGVKPADRPRVRRSNIVCAEPMPGSPEMLEEFVATLKPDLLGELVKTVFDKMQLAGEAGSLLKIEEEIRTAIDTARKEWLKQQDDLLTRKDGSQEEFFDTAEQQVIDALRTYAEQADADSYQRRLFADDAARGFAFIDLCRKRYDAVVMNPPFGEPPPAILDYVSANIPGGRNDIYAAVIMRSLEMLRECLGLLGAITSRAFVVGRDLRDYRAHLIGSDGPNLACLLDLGGGVLDGAMVETAAYIVSTAPQSEVVYFDGTKNLETLTGEFLQDPEQCVVSRLSTYRSSTDYEFLFKLAESRIRELQSREAFAPDFADVTQGLTTENDIRFVRLVWEAPFSHRGNRWYRLAKGGDYSWWTSSLHLLVNRQDDGSELGAYASQNSGNVARTRQSSKFYGLPAATYSRRSQKGFSCRRLRGNNCFSDKSGVIFPAQQKGEWLRLLPFILASDEYLSLIHGQAKFGSYEVGAIKKLPRPLDDWTKLHGAANEIYAAVDQLEVGVEVSALFCSPVLDLEDRNADGWESVIKKAQQLLKQCGLTIATTVANNLRSGAVALDSEWTGPTPIISYALGTAFGRWDIRFATGERQPPELPDPFDPLPVCPPGMLQGEDGLPLSKDELGRMNDEGEYPLRVTVEGIFVDDENHPEDLVARVREAIEVIWADREGGSKQRAEGRKEDEVSGSASSPPTAYCRPPTARAEAIEQEACEILGVKTLRDYFRRPAGFFADHLKRYSKSRRQAPIYWPLSTQSGSYTLWLYYHRLTPDTLFACVTNFVAPKQEQTERTLARLGAKNPRTAAEEKEYEAAAALIGELATFRAELERLAKIWKPNLNDGVQITAAPLWSLFRLPKWQKTLKETWQELEKGDYDWAHLSLSLWPERVIPKCVKDRSLAIAHGFDEDLWEEVTEMKGKKSKTTSKPRKDATEIVARLVAERTGKG